MKWLWYGLIEIVAASLLLLAQPTQAQ